MGQRDDVRRSLEREEGREAREVYRKRAQAREGWRQRLANVERLLAKIYASDPVHPDGAILEEVLSEIRSMIDGDEWPLIGTSSRAPAEVVVRPVRESER